MSLSLSLSISLPLSLSLSLSLSLYPSIAISESESAIFSPPVLSRPNPSSNDLPPAVESPTARAPSRPECGRGAAPS